ncbi:hypothetical protein EMCRGX_G004264 [Ephydatia muelleri]
MATPDDEAALQMSQEAETPEDLITEPVLSIRMLMSSRDVGSIIGKGGITIKTFREQSGARINISNSTSSERLVTITGNRESICKAFEAIGVKIEQDQAALKQPIEGVGVAVGVEGSTTISFRLVIQTSQCGSLIGKGGSKIKDIREKTGASIQVAGETLPNSTERAVTISGSHNALTMAISQITNIMLENPPRGPFIPYKPHAPPNQTFQPRVTVGVANGGYITDGATAHSFPPDTTSSLPHPLQPSLPYQAPYSATFQTAAGPATTTQQMRIPNDLIGCVIGRKGQKIHEIRVTSGAQIKIANSEGESTDRLVTITGTPEAVGMAQYLINSSCTLEYRAKYNSS